jgi:hypothetical protein
MMTSSESKGRRKIRRLGRKIAKMRAQRWVARGENNFIRGELEEALACCKKSLSIYDNLRRAYGLMAKVLMPGDDYVAVLSRFHDVLKPGSYVEIGVASGKTLALTKEGTKAVGIDPSPSIEEATQLHAKLFRTTSDDFFESYHLLEVLGTSRLALAFIDGLHHSEQVLKDFINFERYADKETVILLHDCLPMSRLVTARPPSTTFWCGDVWKVIPCLMKYRPDLTIRIIPARPSGLGMITNLDPTSTVLMEKSNKIATEFQNQELDYDYLDLNKDRLSTIVPHLVPNDWQHINEMLFSLLTKNEERKRELKG